MLYWVLLIVANIPLYALIAWVVFDDIRDLGDSVLQNLCNILFRVIAPVDFRKWFMDFGHATNTFDTVMYLGACVLLTWGEHLLLQKFGIVW